MIAKCFAFGLARLLEAAYPMMPPPQQQKGCRIRCFPGNWNVGGFSCLFCFRFSHSDWGERFSWGPYIPCCKQHKKRQTETARCINAGKCFMCRYVWFLNSLLPAFVFVLARFLGALYPILQTQQKRHSHLRFPTGNRYLYVSSFV